MAQLLPLPDPDPVEPDARDSWAPDEAVAARTEPGNVLRGVFSARGRNPPRRPKTPYIATPAPGSFARDIPAGDTGDEGARTEWWHTEDTFAAETARLQCQNVAKNLLDRLPLLVAHEQRLLRELRLLQRESRRARRTSDELAEQARYIAAADGAASRGAAVARRGAAAASRTAATLERLQVAAEFKVNRLGHEIDTTASQVHEGADIAIGHFWRNYEARWLERSHLGGMWRDPMALTAWAQRKFDELAGAPQIPSKPEIAERIQALRTSSAQHDSNPTSPDNEFV